MQLIPQRKRLKIDNVEPTSTTSDTKRQRRHSELLPDFIRCIICGPSNCGKTNVMIALLQDPNGLKFQNVYLYSRTSFQPKYVNLGKIFSKIKGLGFFVYPNSTNIISPSSAKRNSVFIFDDVASDKQDIMKSYFSMARHSLVDCFYLIQTYSRVPKQLIRDNANVIIAFRQDEMNLRHIFDDHVSPDMSFDQFRQMCATCWTDKHGFLVIDKESESNNGRYRKGFDVYIKR